eukprot:scaffold40033_cov37-Tisochrysis_lutea.AAC.3
MAERWTIAMKARQRPDKSTLHTTSWVVEPRYFECHQSFLGMSDLDDNELSSAHRALTRDTLSEQSTYMALSKRSASDCDVVFGTLSAARTGCVGLMYSMPADCIYAWQKRRREPRAQWMRPNSCVGMVLSHHMRSIKWPRSKCVE